MVSTHKFVEVDTDSIDNYKAVESYKSICIITNDYRDVDFLQDREEG